MDDKRYKSFFCCLLKFKYISFIYTIICAQNYYFCNYLLFYLFYFFIKHLFRYLYMYLKIFIVEISNFFTCLMFFTCIDVVVKE